MTNEEAIKRLNWVREQIDEKPIHYTHQALDMAIKALSETHECDYISRQAAIDALGEEPEVRSDNDQYDQYDLGLNNQWWDDVNTIKGLPPAQPETTKEYNLKSIYNIYVKIAQAHFVYQPSKPKTITAMPFDWIETQNLLEKYLKDHGADFDALCREYISENVKDDYLTPVHLAHMMNAFMPQKGKWIDDTYCSICGWANEVESGFIGSVNGFNFCPNCGKEMQHD